MGVHHAALLALEGIFDVLQELPDDVRDDFNFLDGDFLVGTCSNLLFALFSIAEFHDEPGNVSFEDLGQRHPVVVHAVQGEQGVLVLQQQLKRFQAVA